MYFEKIKKVTAGHPSWHVASEADELIGSAYRKLHTLKFDFDQWEEIPSSLRPLYDQICSVASAVGELRQKTGQLREDVKKAAK
jgi:hypothetical protein